MNLKRSVVTGLTKGFKRAGPPVVLAAVLIAALPGCSTKKPAQNLQPPIAGVVASRGGAATVTVSRKGETLYSLSKRYTGKGSNWTKIAAANPGMNPQKIRPGQKILIPEILLPAEPRESLPALVLVKGKSSDVSDQLISRPIAKEHTRTLAAGASVVSGASAERRGSLRRDVRLPSPGDIPSIREEELLETVLIPAEPAPQVRATRAVRAPSGTRMFAKPNEAQAKESPTKAAPQTKGQAKKKSAAATKSQKTAQQSARYKVIASSGYGSLNREVSRLDAELAKAEALAAEARKQQAAVPAEEPVPDGGKNFFSCSKNKCSQKK